MAKTLVRGHRVTLVPGEAPSIELMDGKKVLGRCTFSAVPPAERLVRDPETRFVEVFFDLGEYERVVDLLRSGAGTWIDDEVGGLLAAVTS